MVEGIIWLTTHCILKMMNLFQPLSLVNCHPICLFPMTANFFFTKISPYLLSIFSSTIYLALCYNWLLFSSWLKKTVLSKFKITFNCWFHLTFSSLFLTLLVSSRWLRWTFSSSWNCLLLDSQTILLLFFSYIFDSFLQTSHHCLSSNIFSGVLLLKIWSAYLQNLCHLAAS